MRLTNMEAGRQEKAVRSLYREAFPRSEKKPWWMLKKLEKKGNAEFLCIEDEEGGFEGLAIMMIWGDLALLDYFAISPECRGQNVGSRALCALQQRYGDKKLLLEIESTTGLEPEPENPGEKLRRKAFYLRNGMTPMDYLVDLFGVEVEVLTHGSSVTFEEYHSIFENLFPAFLAKKVRRI